MPTLTDVLPDVTAWNQNMKNASVPTWENISDQVYHRLHSVIKPLSEFGIPQATISRCVNNIADTCADQVTNQMQNTDTRVQTSSLQRASRALRDSHFRAGIYDKANHCPWVACEVLTASLWIDCFLSDRVKSEVFRADTQVAAQFVLYTHLLHCATHAFTGPTRRQTARWQANPLYNTQTAQQLQSMRANDRGLSSAFQAMWKQCLGSTRALLSTSQDTFVQEVTRLNSLGDDRSANGGACAYPVPGCYDLQKFKSDVYMGQFKLREVVTHAKHPYRSANKRMGRVLSIVWRQAAATLKSMEIISMNDMLPWVRKVKQPVEGFWLELDLKEMFMSIPKEAVLTALTFCLDTITSEGNHRNGVMFSVSKNGNKKRDCIGFKSREFFQVFTAKDVLSYVEFSLTIDCMFVGASSIFQQVTGVPQGGSLSAQLASIYCMWREAKRLSPICRALPSLRYRDNFLFLISPEWIIRVFHNTRAFR